MLTVVIAPDSFKGSATARQAAEAVATGWLRARPEDRVVQLPMADGGEGTLDVIAAALPGTERVPVQVRGPDDRTVCTHWLRLPNGVALVELAACSGLLLLGGRQREGSLQGSADPRHTHTFGTGEAILAAIRAGARRVCVTLGGSATSDGGAGLLSALGARLLDDTGEQIPLGNLGLERLSRIDLSGVELPADGIVAWTDVRSPLLGPAGAVAVFGPQKGLRGQAAARAEAALAKFAELARPEAATSPGAGAAGGTGFGLLALGARLTGGAAAVSEAVGLKEALSTAGLVITGEGSYDEQSEQGKVVSLVADLADRAHARRMLVAGRVRVDPRGFEETISLTELAADQEPALDPVRDAAELLEIAGQQLARSRD